MRRQALIVDSHNYWDPILRNPFAARLHVGQRVCLADHVSAHA